ncbi:uncharacterized protein, partial [Antedon mediterranea]|uniref:uncharacterized protein n=1 Tax=Antedon mediterranea TaxID=105859 RepID=UPI003AF9689B
YRFSEHVFELDPPLKRTQYRLDRVKLMRWVRTHRAPLFFKTDLYLHYILCKHLLKTHLYQPTHAITTEYGLKDKTLDRRLLSKCLSKASGMRRFRTFLVGTAGERGYEFWIDAERFRKATTDDKELSRELFREISAKYYKNGGVMELWDEWKPFSELKRRKRDVMLTAVSDAATDSSINNNNEILNTFTIVQGFILKSLQNYWVPRFLIRCKATWIKNREVQKDIVYQPDCCMVHVRNLSELTDTDEGANKQEMMSDNIKVARKTHLKSQSVNNLLSMFTSSSIRRSELAAMLKLEDTGETTTANKDQYDENEWNTSDGFPLPTISEEDISEETEPTTPPPPEADNACVEPVLTPKEKQEQQQKTEIVSKKSEVFHDDSQKECKSQMLDLVLFLLLNCNIRLFSVNAVEVDLKKQISKETVTNKKPDEIPTNIDETTQQVTESDEDKKQDTKDDDEEKRIDNEKFNQYHERFKKMAQRRRQSFATPELLARDSSSSSMRRLSWSSSGVASLRRISTGSFTTEKQEVIVTKTPVPPKKKKYKPQKRRQQAMSVEFRLGDFSMLMQSLTNESSAPTTTAEETTKPKAGKKGKKKPIGDPSLEDALKLGLPQLQADILALQKVKEDGPKKKKKTKTDEEPPNATKGGRRGSIKADSTKMAGRRRKVSSGRRVSGEMGPLTKANLARLEQIANKAMGKSCDNEDKLKLPEIKKPSIISIGTEQTVSQSECDPMVSSLPSLTNKSHLSAFHKVSVTEPCYVYWNLRSVVNKTEIVSVFDTIVSDRLAGGPFENFLRRNGQQQNINCLKFWQKSEDYLNTAIYQCDVSGHRVRYITAMHIKTVYLASSSSQCIQLGNDLMEKLAEYLTLDSYVADEFVRYVQGLVCEKLREVLQLFKKYDGEDFLNRTTRKKAARFWMKRSDQQQAASILPSSLTNHQQPPKKDDITDDKSGNATTSKTNADDDTGLSKALVPRRMIKSLERAKSLSAFAKNENEDSMADLSDPDSDSDDEGSLKPTKIKVIRKCKEEVKYIEEPEKIESKEETKAVEKIEIRRTQTGRIESKDMLKASGSTLETIKKNGKTLHRPLQPKSFSEILRDSSQLEFFKRFLAREKSDLPILFWQSVENMKNVCKDAKSRQSKTNQIVRKYFNKSTGYGSALQCSAEIIEDIPYLDKVTPQMIMSAQVCVAKSIEDNWFELYRDSFPEEEAETTGTESLLTIRMAPGQKSKALWGMFISNVASVRRGLMNPVLLNLFEKFVQKEVHKELEKQKQTGVQSKRMICNKVVIVDRIQNDLRFWAEVERYKQLTDNAARAASQGTYTIDDEEFVQLKARAIISCYIDSHVLPKLQINISQELADQILDTANSGLIERGLFHDAIVSIFAVVLYCWKKFCRERIAPSESATLTKPPKTKKRSKRSPLKFKNGQYKLKHITGTSVDDPPKITFNLQQGLELILPPKPKSAVNHDRYRNMMRQLYQSGEFDSGGTNDILLNVMQQSSQGMSAKQHRRFSQSINSIRQQLKFAQQFMPAGVPN